LALYDSIGRSYAELRQPDQRIAAVINAALGDATRVVNVGAGTGSYEPLNRTLLAVEPSDAMIRQRPAGAAPCQQGVAEALPIDTKSVDAAMAILTVHHWTDIELGLREMARVARKRVVLLTWVPDTGPFWLTEEYFPEIFEIDCKIFPSTRALSAILDRNIGPVHIAPVPIPYDCTDGFLCAYWRRPDAYLNSKVRGAISTFTKIDPEAGLARLRADLLSGRWAERHQNLLSLNVLDFGYRIFRCDIDGQEG
jgi:SAM-dependent methyltransferase